MKNEEQKNSQVKSRVTNVKAQLREEKLQVQREIKRNRFLITHIKDKHSQILQIEEKIQWVTNMIKQKKSEGLSAEEVKKRDETKR